MNKVKLAAALLLGSTVLLGGCEQANRTLFGKTSEADVKLADYPQRVYWGDTHLHTANSPDAFGFGARLGPEEALRFAMGQEVTSSTGIKAKLDRPLDFLVVTDHSDGLGSLLELYNAPRMMITEPHMLRWYDMIHKGGREALKATAEIIDAKATNSLPPELVNPEGNHKRVASTWSRYIDTVDRYDHPGKFTALFGFEYTLMNGGNNLHRNVIFRDGADKVRKVFPIDSFGTTTPDKLWAYMDTYEKDTGGKVLAIPHNSNMSNGLMFMLTDPNGGPMTAAYAKRRAAHEPVVEITQIKGDSEAHPFMSPNDEFAGYGKAGWELGNLMMTEDTKPEMNPGSYVREALKRGLQLEAKTGENPYKFGVIGSTDSHTGLSTADESNYFGKHSGVEPRPGRSTEAQNLGSRHGRVGWNYLASGYAAVWARANTRSAIWDALKRREVYATTGPRMVVRFFAGWNFNAESFKGDWVQQAYAHGVPMGGQLDAAPGGRPSFLISALKDPIGANLDRVQVVKGWVDAAGQSHEKVFDVVWSNAETRKLAGGKLSPVGDTVNTDNATFQNTIGAPALTTVWTDPEFNAANRAFYYLRVLEIPTPTWVAFDKVRFKLNLPADIPLKQQERAYTSPIWYNPS